jgi:acyl carrier protein
MLMVALVSLIENELDVMIPLHGAAKIETVGDLIDHVAKELS